MVTSLAGFDATTVDPNFGGGSFFPVSDQKGHLVIITADNGFKPAKSGQGNFLSLTIKAQEGSIAGQETELRLNLQHSSQGAVAAAQAQLSAICHVVGVPRPNTTADLFNRPFRVVSELQDSNKPDGYTQLANNGIRDVHGNKPGGQAQQGGASAQPPQMPAGQPPAGNFQQPPQGQGGFQQQQPPAGAFQQQPPQGGQQAGGWGQQGGQPPQGQQGQPGWGQAGQQAAPPQGQGGGGWGQGQPAGGGAPGWAQG